MTKRKAPKSTDGFKVNQCSMCEEFTLTVGQQKIGGVRFCRDCFRHTLAWVQFSEEQRAKLLSVFGQIEAQPHVQALLAAAAKIPAELKKANSIGESRRRLYESERME